jgi:hypothetical protein
MIKDIACELGLDRDTFKTLKELCLAAQLARVGVPRCEVVGIDDISIHVGAVHHPMAVERAKCRFRLDDCVCVKFRAIVDSVRMDFVLHEVSAVRYATKKSCD